MDSKLICWAFLPNDQDRKREWVPSSNYNTAAFGEIRFRFESDTPMSDEKFFQPGWKRLPHLDQKN